MVPESPTAGRSSRLGLVDVSAAEVRTTSSAHVAPDASTRLQRRLTIGVGCLGIGLGGFVDGIVLHQILQWHHMLTDYGDHVAFPVTSVSSLEENTLWDGLFHVSTWVFVVVGVVLLWRTPSPGRYMGGAGFVGTLLAGWGLFNVVEGLVDHHLLTIHHVRDDVAEPLWWDVGFLGFGAALIVAGVVLRRWDGAGRTRPHPSGCGMPGSGRE